MTGNGNEGSSKDGVANLLNKEGEAKFPAGSAKYKNVISWIKDYDGSFSKYMRFSNDCNMAFEKINKDEYGALLCYVQKQLDESKFAFLLGAEFRSWKELKKLYLDEHFEIRLNEKDLFRELVNMKRKDKERLFEYHNRLIYSRNEYRYLIISFVRLL